MIRVVSNYTCIGITLIQFIKGSEREGVTKLFLCIFYFLNKSIGVLSPSSTSP